MSMWQKFLAELPKLDPSDTEEEPETNTSEKANEGEKIVSGLPLMNKESITEDFFANGMDHQFENLPDEDIPLADYGSSNTGKLKTLYRSGLGIRYGRRMQTIAGLHYNLY